MLLLSNLVQYSHQFCMLSILTMDLLRMKLVYHMQQLHMVMHSAMLLLLVYMRLYWL